MTQTPEFYDEPAGDMPAGFDAADHGSLTDSVIALLDDGKTYVESEIQFQKTRALFALDRGKSGVILGLVAAALIFLALIALVVGALFGLVPIIGVFGATLVVVGVLVVAAALFALAAKRKFGRLVAAYQDTRE